MYEHIVWYFVAGKFQHRRPEQRMKIGDVLADEMHLFGRRISHEGIEITSDFAEIVFQRCQVADRRIQPHIKILARSIRDFNPEVRCIAADIPVAEAAITFQPFSCLVCDFRLQARLAGGVSKSPVAQKIHTLRIG